MDKAQTLADILSRAIQQPQKAIGYINRTNIYMWYYRLTSDSHTEAYRKLVNRNIGSNPKGRCSGEWGSGVGKMQFEFLKDQGIENDDRLLDIGCGKLRGGRYFIDYLDKRNYVGMDISQAAIDEGKSRLDEGMLENKNPQFINNNDLTFKDVNSHTFDYILAQSVFTHLPESETEQAFANIHHIMDYDSKFYATFILRDKPSPAPTGYTYSEQKLSYIARDNELSINFFNKDDYPHPQDQRMTLIQIER